MNLYFMSNIDYNQNIPIYAESYKDAQAQFCNAYNMLLFHNSSYPRYIKPHQVQGYECETNKR